MASGTIISIVNHRSGVGKTVTSCNLGHALARAGKQVLVVDMDLQCDTTSTLYGRDRPKHGLSELLNPYAEIKVEQCICGTPYENLYVIPNTRETAGIEQQLIRRYPKGLSLFRDRFREYARKNFDFVLIDNPPNLGTFVLCSLTASDFAIVPSQTGSKHSIEGLNEALRFIEDLRQSENGNPDLRFLKVLLTRVDQRRIVHKASMAQIRNYYPEEKVFHTIIPTNTAVQQAEMSRTTVFKHRSNAAAALAYTKLSQEIMTSLKKGAR